MRVLYLGPAEMLDHVCRELPEGTSVVHGVSEDGIDEAIVDADVVLDASMRFRFDRTRLARAGRLRAYVTATTGADHVDGAALENMGVPLLTLEGERQLLANITAAAEHSWLLVLACVRQLRGAISHVIAGKWERIEFPGVMLNGRTLGIVGCGRIGSWVGRYGRAFGMRAIGYDPFVADWPAHIESSSLGQLLSEADVVTIHVPLSDRTKGLISRSRIESMKPGAVLINTSRGEIVDEAALIDALKRGRIAAAGFDVLTGEPETASHPLVEYARSHDNLIITPHIGGFSPDAVRVVLTFSCRRIAALLT